VITQIAPCGHILALKSGSLGLCKDGNADMEKLSLLAFVATAIGLMVFLSSDYATTLRAEFTGEDVAVVGGGASPSDLIARGKSQVARITR
jgi:hypothetical protein